ncbi:50S ribosomal protein L17 [Gemmata sp. JC717]|uniref:50S ribosomal protein L17 n=1 Tax=Gemmata algarum TaxID=2975278 RepID=UPI0021BB6652|nr:50S ribosomal protein L17 [Gemmata algarum]MDY3550993.1 50S ribosomal protein L17 [Gemmata algarum]
MRHRKRGRHLNRNAAHRRSLFRNLTRALITHERIVTTLPKAKELRPFVEKIVTLAKKANVVIAAAAGKGEVEEKAARIKALHYRRQAMALLGPTHGTEIWDKKDESTGDTVLKKLFREIGPRFSERPGGYTRILKQHYRRLGDGGATAVIEFLKSGETKVQKKGPAPVAPAPAPVVAETPASTETPAS